MLFYYFFFFFFNDTATTEIYTLSLHDALPICPAVERRRGDRRLDHGRRGLRHRARQPRGAAGSGGSTEIRMNKSAECGVRNAEWSERPSTPTANIVDRTLHFNSAFRIPHSALSRRRG